jgi:hypothetical protein
VVGTRDELDRDRVEIAELNWHRGAPRGRRAAVCRCVTALRPCRHGRFDRETRNVLELDEAYPAISPVSPR